MCSQCNVILYTYFIKDIPYTSGLSIKLYSNVCLYIFIKSNKPICYYFTKNRNTESTKEVGYRIVSHVKKENTLWKIRICSKWLKKCLVIQENKCYYYKIIVTSILFDVGHVHLLPSFIPYDRFRSVKLKVCSTSMCIWVLLTANWAHIYFQISLFSPGDSWRLVLMRGT